MIFFSTKWYGEELPVQLWFDISPTKWYGEELPVQLWFTGVVTLKPAKLSVKTKAKIRSSKISCGFGANQPNQRRKWGMWVNCYEQAWSRTYTREDDRFERFQSEPEQGSGSLSYLGISRPRFASPRVQWKCVGNILSPDSAQGLPKWRNIAWLIVLYGWRAQSDLWNRLFDS